MASKYQNKVINDMKLQGFTVVSVVKLSSNGYPDLMCMKAGDVVWIECKESNDTLKPLQKYRIDELRLNGFEAYCLQDGKGKIY